MICRNRILFFHQVYFVFVLEQATPGWWQLYFLKITEDYSLSRIDWTYARLVKFWNELFSWICMWWRNFKLDLLVKAGVYDICTWRHRIQTCCLFYIAVSRMRIFDYVTIPTGRAQHQRGAVSRYSTFRAFYAYMTDIVCKMVCLNGCSWEAALV